MSTANGNPIESEVAAPESSAPPAVPGFKIFNRIVDWITNDRMQLINVTDRINDIVRKSGIRDGMVHLQSLHTTTAVFINEWQDALLHDVRSFLEDLVTREQSWRHNDPELLRLRAAKRRFSLARHGDGADPVFAGAQFRSAAGHLAEHHPGRVRRAAEPFGLHPGFRRIARHGETLYAGGSPKPDSRGGPPAPRRRWTPRANTRMPNR